MDAVGGEREGDIREADDPSAGDAERVCAGLEAGHGGLLAVRGYPGRVLPHNRNRLFPVRCDASETAVGFTPGL
ncbi:hypothetical protein GCM10022198_12000 [Klugiella xanthotipulae]